MKGAYKKVRFILYDIDYQDINGKTYIRLWGRTHDGKKCCFFDICDSFFYLIPKERVDIKKYIEKIKKVKLNIGNRVAAVTKVEIVNKNYVGKSVKAIKIYVSNHKDVIPIKEIVKDFSETEEKLETDINFITRYILEKNVKQLQWHNAEIESMTIKNKIDVDITGRIKKIDFINSEETFEPSVLGFDIEVSDMDASNGEILMVSIANKRFKKVITWKHFKNKPESVEFVKDEAELINRFKQVIKNEKPDFLVGYFSDGFDMPYLRHRADKLGIKLNLGVDGSNITFIRGVVSSTKIAGIIHIDLFKFVNNVISPSLQSETLTLNEVATELLGDKKLEINLGKINKELKRTKGKLKEAEWLRYSLYNLQDSILAAKLFEKLWPNISEMTRIVEEPVWLVSRSTYSNLVEHYIIHNIKPFNEIIKHRPTRDKIIERREKKKYGGAFVLEPKPGIYNDIVVFDFRSIYPSVIVSFNISPSTILKKKEKNCYETPEFIYDGKKRAFYFLKKQGFIPNLLLRLIHKRKEVKLQLKKHKTALLEARSYALKTLANATYGYYGFFGARWYCRECAASTTATAKHYLMKTIDNAKQYGFNVIYGDTDSLMIDLSNKTKEEALNWYKQVNNKLPGAMELDIEDFYKRGLFVTTRKGNIGAKKKYALLSEDKSLKIRGFETVRRDWAKLTKEMQDKVLRMILNDGNPDRAFKFTQKIISDLKSKKIHKEMLIIKTQLKKELSAYTAVTPHVIIARKLKDMGLSVKPGSLIEYIVAETKNKKLVREKAKLPDEVSEKEYDATYYIEHQIIPAVENIFAVFGITKEQLSKKQTTLHQF